MILEIAATTPRGGPARRSHRPAIRNSPLARYAPTAPRQTVPASSGIGKCTNSARRNLMSNPLIVESSPEKAPARTMPGSLSTAHALRAPANVDFHPLHST